MEHKVYVCSWSQSSNGFNLWVKSKPSLRGEGADYNDAEKNLLDAIQDAGGAMCAVFEFDPPLPKSPIVEKYTTPEIFLVQADDFFVVSEPKAHVLETKEDMWRRRRWPDEYYDSPICPKCLYVTGRRSEKPLSLSEGGSGTDGAFGTIGYARSTHQLLSEEFLALLTHDERENLQLREVIRRGRRKFYELIGPEGPRLVAVANLPPSGARCEGCDHRHWSYWGNNIDISDFVAASDLPANATVFTVGNAPEFELAVAASRWKEMVGRKGTRGFISKPLGIVPDHEVIRHPDLPTLEECRQAANKRLSGQTRP